MRFWKSVAGMLGARPHRSDARTIENGFRNHLVIVDGCIYRHQVYVPPGWSTFSSRPVILSLHGGGGYGTDGMSQTAEGLASAILRHPDWFPALVVFPQIPADGAAGWQGAGARVALAALDSAIREFHGDPSRIVLTGLSIGGNGVWHLAYHHPWRFAGLLVICGFVAERRGTTHPILYPSLIQGVADPSEAIARRLAHIPTWIFHGDADRTVAVEQSRRMAAALRALGAPVQYTELAGVDHNAWDFAYAQPEVASWLLLQRRGGAAAN